MKKLFIALFLILFVIFIVRTFNDDEINENIRKYARIFAIISCVSFIILGAFCGSNPIIAYIHGISAVICWISGLLYISLYNFLMIKSSNYSKFLGYFGFITTFILSLMLVFFLLHLFPSLRFLMEYLAILEWLNALSIICWYLAVSIYVIYKRVK